MSERGGPSTRSAVSVARVARREARTDEMSEELTHYDVLGVEPTAGKDDIKAAYQERLGEVQADISREQGAKKPDADAIDGFRREEARVRSAWQVLSDPYQRGRYDVTVESGGALVAAGAVDGDEADADATTTTTTTSP